MKSSRSRLSLLLILVLLVVASVTLFVASAFTQSEPTEEELRTGVWRDGRAIIWDLEVLGMFDWYPPGYKPEQPIAFSHQTHVETADIECQYCHSSVAKSAHSNFPSVELCMGCHSLVKTDSEEIKKLKEYYDNKQPIEWAQVHNLPDHARFNHQRHVKAGVGCHNCHGMVQKMDEVEKVSTLKMGWCVSCHREQGASIDCGVCHY